MTEDETARNRFEDWQKMPKKIKEQVILLPVEFYKGWALQPISHMGKFVGVFIYKQTNHTIDGAPRIMFLTILDAWEWING